VKNRNYLEVGKPATESIDKERECYPVCQINGITSNDSGHVARESDVLCRCQISVFHHPKRPKTVEYGINICIRYLSSFNQELIVIAQNALTRVDSGERTLGFLPGLRITLSDTHAIWSPSTRQFGLYVKDNLITRTGTFTALASLYRTDALHLPVFISVS
jgi:hypothetical protein